MIVDCENDISLVIFVGFGLQFSKFWANSIGLTASITEKTGD